MRIRNNVDFAGHEAQNKKEHILGADPSLVAGDAGRTWFNSATGRFRGWNGTTVFTLNQSLATPNAGGTMSAADKTKLDGATSANTPSALVQRDISGNFVAGTISAALTGTASNASALDGQTLAQVRDFAQTTGQRTALAISDFNTAVRLNRLDQMTAPTTLVSMNNQRLVSLADPVNPQDATTKNYVDSIATGLDPKGSVRFGTIAALSSSTYANGVAGVGATLTATANGALIVDGIAVAVNSRILVKNQASQPQNGLYVVTATGAVGAPWVLTRATDADSAAEVSGGMFTFVEDGTLAATGWVLNATGTITIGTTNLSFVQFSGSSSYSAGDGLSLIGNTFAVIGTANRIASSGAGVDIASTYVGQTSIITLGTIGTGIWQGTAVALGYGGTGAITAAGARTNLEAIGRNAIDIPAGTAYSFVHGLNTLDVIAAVVEVATGDVIFADVKVVDANTVSVTFGNSVAANAYRVVVVG